jgi:hypothetical protein
MSKQGQSACLRTARSSRCRAGVVLGLLLSLVVTVGSGCSLVVMAGKMFLGNPRLASEFTMATGVRLGDAEETVVVIARVPSYLSGDLATLESDLITGVTDRLIRESIKATEADEVIDWIDERGTSDDVEGAARKFETDYIVHIELEEFENREENTSSLHRGRARGTVRAYKVELVGGKRVPRMIFDREFQTKHPRQQPVLVGEVTQTAFARRHLEQLCGDLARKFHDHLPGAGI